METTTLSNITAQVLFSSGNLLNGVVIEHLRIQADEEYTLPEEKHCVVLNTGKPLALELRTGDQWIEGICEQGWIACLSSPGGSTTLRFKASFRGTIAQIDPEVANSLLETRNFALASKFNVLDTQLADIINKIDRTVSDEVFSEKVYCDSLIVACMMHLAKLYRGTENFSLPKGKLSPTQLKQVIDYAYSFMQLDVGLHQLAERVHLSPYHFGRLFKQTIGLSPYQYILQLKIEFAKKLIKRREGPIGEIAYKLNFTDQSHFSNAFRKATGISPRQYLMS